ncbi:MAG: phosphatase PAP2 family protein [Spirochaetota bacterium]
MEQIETGIGIQIVEWFQSWGTVVAYALAPLHYLGSEFGYLIVLPLIYWCVDKKAGKRLLILVLGTALINGCFKLWLARPRPFELAPDRIDPFHAEESYGIPSGHTMFATVFGAWVAATIRRRWVSIVSVLAILAMGISRMVHGVHFPQDVLAGWLLGAVVVILFFRIEPAVTGILARLSTGGQLFVVAAFVAVAFAVAMASGDDFEAQKSILSVTGSLAGGLIGLITEERMFGFQSTGRIAIRALRGLLGLFLVGSVYAAVSAGYYAVAGESAGFAAAIGYVVRYAVVGFTATWLAPAVIVWSGLAPATRALER